MPMSIGSLTGASKLSKYQYLVSGYLCKLIGATVDRLVKFYRITSRHSDESQVVETTQPSESRPPHIGTVYGWEQDGGRKGANAYFHIDTQDAKLELSFFQPLDLAVFWPGNRNRIRSVPRALERHLCSWRGACGCRCGLAAPDSDSRLMASSIQATARLHWWAAAFLHATSAGSTLVRCWCIGSCTCHESTLPSEPYRRHSHQSNPYRSCSSWCKGSLQHRSGHIGSMHRQRPSFHHASTHRGPFDWCRHHLLCWPPHLHPLPSKHHGSSPLSCHAVDSVPGCNLHLLHMNHQAPRPPQWIPRFLQQPIQGQENWPGTW